MGNDGEMEVMVHRRLTQDDGRGVAEPLNEMDTLAKSNKQVGMASRGTVYVSVEKVTVGTEISDRSKWSKPRNEAMVELRARMEESFNPLLVATVPGWTESFGEGKKEVRTSYARNGNISGGELDYAVSAPLVEILTDGREEFEAEYVSMFNLKASGFQIVQVRLVCFFDQVSVRFTEDLVSPWLRSMDDKSGWRVKHVVERMPDHSSVVLSESSDGDFEVQFNHTYAVHDGPQPEGGLSFLRTFHVIMESTVVDTLAKASLEEEDMPGIDTVSMSSFDVLEDVVALE